MSKIFRVTGEWLVKADSSTEAENLIENAVARLVDESELEDCNAELEDFEGDPDE